jgi:hypothetical protein
VAPHTLVKTKNGFYFLGHDNQVYLWPNGATEPVAVSHEGVTDAIEQMAIRDDAYAFVTQMQAQRFLHVVFPSEGRCWVMNEKTGLWHERESYEKTELDIAGHVSAWGKQVVFRRSSGEMGLLDTRAEAEWDNKFRSAWTYQEVYSGGRLVAHAELRAYIDTGYGVSHGTVPKLMLEISDDGGETFRVGPEARMGDRGNYGLRVSHNRLGSSEHRVYRHSMFGMGRRQVRDAQLKAKGAIS